RGEKKRQGGERPCGENPTSSGFASGKGAPCATLSAIPTAATAVTMSAFMLSSLGRIDVAYGAITASASGYDLITSAAATSESGLCRLRARPSCPGKNLVACRTARRSAANARRDEADASDARHAGDRRRQRVVATHPLKGFSAIDPGGPVAATDRLRYLLRSVVGGEHRAARLRKLR